MCGAGGGCSQGNGRGGWAGLLEQFSESVLIEDRPNGMTGGPGELALLGERFSRLLNCIHSSNCVCMSSALQLC